MEEAMVGVCGFLTCFFTGTLFPHANHMGRVKHMGREESRYDLIDVVPYLTWLRGFKTSPSAKPTNPWE